MNIKSDSHIVTFTTTFRHPMKDNVVLVLTRSENKLKLSFEGVVKCAFKGTRQVSKNNFFDGFSFVNDGQGNMVLCYSENPSERSTEISFTRKHRVAFI